MSRFVLTLGTMGSLGQPSKRLRFLGALASSWLGWNDRLARGRGIVGAQTAEHQEDTHQSNEPEVVEKKGGYHGNAPADGGGKETLYRIFGLSELSAIVLYTTRPLNCQG